MRNDLPTSDREELERILSLDPSMLTSVEVEHVRARRAYLTKVEQQAFASVLKAPKPAKKTKK